MTTWPFGPTREVIPASITLNWRLATVAEQQGIVNRTCEVLGWGGIEPQATWIRSPDHFRWK
jgi:hypothetical protein